MNLLVASSCVIVLAMAGAGALRVLWPFSRTLPQPARLALGYCIGCWLVTMIFFGAYLAGIRFSRPLVVVPVVLLAVVSVPDLIKVRLRGNSQTLLPALLCVLALALSWLRPVYGYDAVMMWALKAKMMFLARTWPATMFDPFTTAHTEYPPLVPASQAFLFFWSGSFDDVASRTVFAAWFVSGAVLLWWLLGELRVSGRPVWVLWWCALPVTMEQVKLTYADMPLAVYLVVFYGAVLLWYREPSRRDWLWLAGVFGGMAFWVKNDALIGIGAGLLALMIVRKLSWKLALIVGAFAVSWRAFVWIRNLPSDFALKFADLPAKTAQVAAGLFNATILEGAFAFFWPVLLVTLIFRHRRLRLQETSWLVISVGTGAAGLFAVYWFSIPDVAKLLATSLDRVLLNLFVPALFLTAILWRGRFRMAQWQPVLFITGATACIATFWLGARQPSDEELFGITISPFPVALSWMWLAAGAATLWLCWPVVRRHGCLAIWHSAQTAIILASFGLGLVAAAVHARTCGELWRMFGGKTLAQQHLLVVPDGLRRQISLTLHSFPRGTHVQVLPKRSLWRHRFYYETYPYLIVDSTASNVIRLDSD